MTLPYYEEIPTLGFEIEGYIPPTTDVYYCRPTDGIIAFVFQADETSDLLVVQATRYDPQKTLYRLWMDASTGLLADNLLHAKALVYHLAKTFNPDDVEPEDAAS